MIPYAHQSIDKSDVNAVTKALKSKFLTQGPLIEKFERSIQDLVQAKYAISTNSATSALHLACLALNIKKNDIVWTSPISFVSSANCALFCEAKIDFVDIDPLTFNLSVKALEEKLIFAKKNKALPKILVAVHLAGQSCDMLSIKKLSLKYNFKIIEDASHAIGGSYMGTKIGSCKYSDITIFSFHPVKIITTGEGGALVTNNAKIAKIALQKRAHGIVRNTPNPDASEIFYYKQLSLGFNYRMTDFQAALGLSQIKKIGTFIKKRKNIAAIYKKFLPKEVVDFQVNYKKCESSWHLFLIRLKSKKYSQLTVFEYMKKNGINVNLHYIPIYRHPHYKKLGFKKGYCNEAEKYFHSTMTLPIFPELKKIDQIKIINTLRKLYKFEKIL